MADLTHLRSLIRQAVNDAIDPDNTGVVVSGGIDSSTVCVAARDLVGDLPTFTGYYDHPVYDERRYARLVGGSNHHEILITPQDFIDNFDLMVPHLEKPFQGMGTFGQYMVGKYIAENTDVKVVLSGEGSDELFGGYARLLAVAGEPLPDGYENYQIPPTIRVGPRGTRLRLRPSRRSARGRRPVHGRARAGGPGAVHGIEIIEYALGVGRR
jgi:asparagine synthetase B (glutamine-hydrolysing)